MAVKFVFAAALCVACTTSEAPPYGPPASGSGGSATNVDASGTGGSAGAPLNDSGSDNADTDAASTTAAASGSGGANTTGLPLGGTLTGSGGSAGPSSGTGSSTSSGASNDGSDGSGGSGGNGGGGSNIDGGGTSANGGSASASNGSGGNSSAGSGSGGGDGNGSGSPSSTTSGSGGGSVDNPLTNPEDGPPAGNPGGNCAIPSDADLEDISSPDHVIGSGTPASCTAEEFIEAVAEGGVIVFDCGPDPVTITLDEPAKVFNDASDQIVIDGGGLVTLSGGGQTRILYMNTCDPDQVWTTSHCDDQEFPELTVQNITFIDGNSKNEPSLDEERDGGGAIWARGGRFKAVNTRFFNNVCADTGPDVGGAIRVFSQYQGLPAYIVDTTFGGAEGFGNTCSNGGGISSIGVSWTILNSVFSHNSAVGEGGNPAQDGTPGGGSGGAIYNDGQTMTLRICGSLLENNHVKAYGSAIFFVSNNHDGTLVIEDSTIRDNSGGGWNVLPSISMHEDTEQVISNSTIE